MTDAGARVIEAATAEEALARIESSEANILISDIGMAGKDGYELIRSIRARGYDADVLPALSLTAFARMQDRTDALAAGFQDHVVKPIDPATLLFRVSSMRVRKQP